MLASSFFFFNDTATTEIYTLSLHDALPIYYYPKVHVTAVTMRPEPIWPHTIVGRPPMEDYRSEEHTSELQSLAYLVCRLLLEKKKKDTNGWHRTVHKRALVPRHPCAQHATN